MNYHYSKIIIIAICGCIFAATCANAQEINNSVPDAKIEFLTKKDVRLIEAEALIREEKYIDALLLIEDIIRSDVRTDEAYLMAAYSYMKLEKIDQARQTLVNALKLDQRNRAAQNYAGRLALMDNKLREAKGNLSALKTICGGDDCAEYRDLQYRILEIENPKPTASQDE